MKLSSSHLAWDCHHEFICIGINSFASCAANAPWGLREGSPREVRERNERSLYTACHIWEGGREAGEKKHKEERTEHKLWNYYTDSFPRRKRKKKKSLIANQTANERSSTNQIAYLNHLGNIQQLIKHPAPRPRFHILSWRTLTQAEAL